MSRDLFERIREAVQAGANVEPEDSDWKPCRHWAKEWKKSDAQAMRYLRAAVESGLMEAKRGRVLGPTGARAAMFYREVPPRKSKRLASSKLVR